MVKVAASEVDSVAVNSDRTTAEKEAVSNHNKKEMLVKISTPMATSLRHSSAAEEAIVETAAA